MLGIFMWDRHNFCFHQAEKVPVLKDCLLNSMFCRIHCISFISVGLINQAGAADELIKEGVE